MSASDISDAMASEARTRYEAAVAEGGNAPSTAPTFEGKDLESLNGKWDIVTCLDVLIHYDQVGVHWHGCVSGCMCARGACTCLGMRRDTDARKQW